MHKQARVASEQLSITDWVKDLAAIPEREFTLETVQNYIANTPFVRKRWTSISFSRAEITHAT